MSLNHPELHQTPDTIKEDAPKLGSSGGCMPLLNSRSPESELQCWIDYWSGKYRVEDDNPVMTIAASHSGYLTIADVVTIFGWKLKGLWPGSKIKAIESFDLANPGVIRSSTASALGAKTDFEALKFLRALPGMQ
jgi:hypothetical protein